MADGKPYEVEGVEDKEQFQTRHGSTLQARQLSVKGPDKQVISVGMNFKPSTPRPQVGETMWLEVWENEHGFLKAKKVQGPRQQQQGFASDGSRDRSIVRQHSQHMALKWAALIVAADPEVMRRGPTGGEPLSLNTIEAFTDWFDADVQRVSGTAQEVGGAAAGETRPASAPAPSRTPNGGNPDTITPKQITHFILPRQKMNGLSDDDMRLLVKSFGLERLKDLPKSRVDEFVQAMVNPIPTGESDVPGEFESTPASPADDEIPF